MGWMKKIIIFGIFAILLCSLAYANINYSQDSYLNWECGTRKNTSLLCNITYQEPLTITSDVVSPSVTDYISYWRFNENDNVDDETGRNNLTNNGATYTDSGYFGGGYVFDNGDYMDIATFNDFNGKQGTLCMWFYQIITVNSSDFDRLFVRRTGASDELTVFITEDELRHDIGSTNALVINDSIEQNQWNHFCITYNTTNHTTRYYNGQSIATQSWSGSPISGGGMTIGDASYSYVGTLDEVIYFNRSLSPTEVTEIYNMSAVIPTNTTYFYQSTDGGNSWNTYCVGCDKFNATDSDSGLQVRASSLLDDTETTLYTTNTTAFEYDNVTPVITWIIPKDDNTTIFEQDTTNALRIDFTDDNLFSYNVTVYDFEISPRTSVVVQDITTTEINYVQIIEMNTTGIWTVYAEVTDDHTTVEINDFEIQQKADVLQFDEIKITATDSIDSDYSKERDRYNFEFKYPKGTLIKEYVLESNNKLYYRQSSEYKAHFVDFINKKWVDFEGVEGTPEVEQLTNKSYKIIIRDSAEVMTFNSVGTLNVVNETRTFVVQPEGTTSTSITNFDLTTTPNILLLVLLSLLWVGLILLGRMWDNIILIIGGYFIGMFLGLVFLQVSFIFTAFLIIGNLYGLFVYFTGVR